MKKIRRVGRDKFGASVWKCLCTCGKKVNVSIRNLYRTKSCGCSRKKPPEEVYLRYLYNIYRVGARRYNRKFTLPKDTFDILVTSNCHYCEKPPALRKQKRYGKKYDVGCKVNGLDRMDNSKGYFYDNVVTCCWRCNHLKGRKSYEEFRGKCGIL